MEAANSRRQGCRCSLLLVLFTVAFNAQAVAASIDLYVSPSGSDTGSSDGSFSRPFRTLTRAQQQVRLYNSLPANAKVPINVFLRAGRYALSSTFDLTSEDSGASTDATVTYQAFCDAAVESAAVSVRTFPYDSGKGRPPRLLWNGVGDINEWEGPVDSFAQMEVNRSANSLEVTPAPAQDVGTDIGTVCVDKNNDVGHTCYAEGPLATCVSGCMVSCQNHIARKRYSKVFYDEFTHLFGKDLRKEEDCVEICSLSCRGCEKVVISGSKLLNAGMLTWTLDRSITVGSQVLKIFRTDLSSVLPGLAGVVPSKPEDFATFTTLFVDGVMMPRAGFPNCLVPSSSQTLSCSYEPVDVVDSKVIYNPTTFSSRVSTWTNVKEIVLDLKPQRQQPSSLRYSVASVDNLMATVQLGAGGSELSYDIFTNGPGDSFPASADPTVRVENVVQELDSPVFSYSVSTSQQCGGDTVAPSTTARERLS